MELWWERLEVEPSKSNTVKEFLEEKNFTWEILSKPCYQKIGDDFVVVPNHQISVRSDNNRPISVIKNRFKLLNNDKCFEIADIFKNVYKDSYFVNCGDIMNQKESYLTMYLKTEIICDDEFYVWLTFTNGFDGRNAVNATLTLMRKADHAVFQMFDDKHPRIWTLGRIDIKSKFNMINQGIEKYIKYTKTLCEKLRSKEINLNQCINPIFDIEWKHNGKRHNKYLATIKEYSRQIYLQRNGKNLYDLFFATSSYFCNEKRLRNDKLYDDRRFQLGMVKYFYELYEYQIKLLAYMNGYCYF